MSVNDEIYFNQLIQNGYKEANNKSLLNQLRELSNAKEYQKRRWVWELIQNASDSISGDPNRKTVNISIHIAKEFVIFEHNGSPFTDEQFAALICKFSKGKDGNRETTGQFGTGFVSTHILSRTIQLKSSFIKKDGELETRCFTIYREADNVEDINKVVRDTKFSDAKNDGKQQNTVYKYVFDQNIPQTIKQKDPHLIDRRKEAAKLGVLEFFDNISTVMCFNNKIQKATIKIDKDVNYLEKNLTGKTISFERLKSDNRNEVIIKETNGNKQVNHTFILDETNIIEQKYFEENVFIQGAIEIDKKNNKIVSKNRRNSIFIVYPLLGYENFKYPIIINSPNFNPTTERDGLLFNDSEMYSTLYSNQNKLILEKSINIYGRIINYCSELGITNMYLLLNGLKEDDISKELIKGDLLSWYKTQIIAEICKIFIQKKVIFATPKDNSKEKKLVQLESIVFTRLFLNENYELTILISDKYGDRNLGFDQFYKITHGSKIFPYSLSLEDCKIWANYVYSQSFFLTPEYFAELLEKNLPYTTFSNDYIKNVVTFLPKEILEKRKLIPTLSGDFVEYSNKIAKCPKVNVNAIQIANDLNLAWTKEHIQSYINLPDIETHDINDFSNELIKAINEDENKAKLFFKYIPITNKNKSKNKNDDPEKNFYESLFNYSKKLLITNEETKQNNISTNILPLKVWQETKTSLLKQLLIAISERKTMENIPFKLYDFLNQINITEYQDLLHKYEIIPNKNNELCKIDILKKQINIDEEILKVYNSLFEKDLNKEIIHPQFINFGCSNTITMEEILSQFNDLLNNHDKSPKAFSLAKELIYLIPKQTKQSSSPSIELQKSLNNVWISLNDDDEQHETKTISFTDPKLWTQANNIIIKKISEQISRYKDLNEFISNNENISNNETCINLLNTCYNVMNNDIIINVPNRKGIFMNPNQLFICAALDDDFIKIYKEVIGDDLNDKLVYDKIKNKNILEKDSQEFKKRLTQRIDEILNSNDEKLKQKLQKILSSSLIISKLGSDSSQERSEILYKTYANNLHNSLHNIMNYADHQKKRWGWELIQNACDSISNDLSRTKVDVVFKYTDDSLLFYHNGSPFTHDQFMGLVYCFSHGKENNDSSVGQFGTGFCSTHIISRTIQLKTDYYENDTKKHIELTMNREGDNKNDLIEGIKKTINSIKYSSDITGKTVFKYIFKTDKIPECKRIALLGIQELLINLPKVFCFNEKLGSVTILFDQNCKSKFGKKVSKVAKYYFKKENSVQIDDNIFQTTISRVQDKTTIYKTFITVNEHKDLSSFSFDVTGLLVLDQENKRIIFHKNNNIDGDKEKSSEQSKINKSCVFLTYPLLGFEDFQFPFIINSNNFIPTTERTSLFLKGQYYMDDKNTNLSAYGKNMEILKCSINIYSKLLSYCCSTQIENMYYLMNGLKCQQNDKIFDTNSYELYQKQIIEKMRRIFLDNPTVLTNDGFKKLSNQISNKDDDKCHLIDCKANTKIISKYYYKCFTLLIQFVPKQEQTQEWNDYIWSDKFVITFYKDESKQNKNKKQIQNKETFRI